MKVQIATGEQTEVSISMQISLFGKSDTYLNISTDEFVSLLDFDSLLIWAEALGVPPDLDFWLDDEYPDKEAELRVEVEDVLEKRRLKLKKYYFTFGFNQPHENCYTVIETRDSSLARQEMFDRWGQKWSMQYNSAEAAGGKKFNLKRIK